MKKILSAIMVVAVAIMFIAPSFAGDKKEEKKEEKKKDEKHGGHVLPYGDEKNAK